MGIIIQRTVSTKYPKSSHDILKSPLEGSGTTLEWLAHFEAAVCSIQGPPQQSE